MSGINASSRQTSVRDFTRFRRLRSPGRFNSNDAASNTRALLCGGGVSHFDGKSISFSYDIKEARFQNASKNTPTFKRIKFEILGNSPSAECWKSVAKHVTQIKLLQLNIDSFAEQSLPNWTAFIANLPASIDTVIVEHNKLDFDGVILFKPILMQIPLSVRVLINGEDTTVLRLLNQVKRKLVDGKELKKEFIFDDIDLSRINTLPAFTKLLHDVGASNSPLSCFIQALLLSGEMTAYYPDESSMQEFVQLSSSAIKLYAKAIDQKWFFTSERELSPTVKMLLSLMLEKEQNRFANVQNLASFNPEDIEEYNLFFAYLHKVCATIKASAVDIMPIFKERDYTGVVPFANVNSIPTFNEFKSVECRAIVPVRTPGEIQTVTIAPGFATFMRREMLKRAELVKQDSIVPSKDEIVVRERFRF